MTSAQSSRNRRLTAAALILLLVGLMLWVAISRAGGDSGDNLPVSFTGDSLVCAIAVDDRPLVRDGLVAGLNIELIKRCALADSFAVRFVRPLPEDNVTDSLAAGHYDLIVIAADSLQGSFSSVPAPGEGVVWAVAPVHDSKADSLESWLTGFMETEDFVAETERFNCVRAPRKAFDKGWKLTRISPYDALLRAGARELQWDWRLLAALVFTESKFSVTAESHRGAFGLMQIVPADRDERNHLLNPELNLAHGTAHLRRLQRLFRSRGVEEPEDLQHIVVAAYNAGEGRMTDLMTLAEAQGLEPGRWESIESVIPLMAEYADSIETVARGRFRGTETLAYVDSVFTLYGLYCTLLR